MPISPHIEQELETHLVRLRAAQPGITAGEAAPLLPEHLRQPFWARAVDRYVTAEMAKLTEEATP
jgi:hypothetical protein